MLLPRGRFIVQFLASRPEFVGVGKATAQRLWDAFAEELYAILGDGDVKRLSEVLHESQAKIVIDAWRNELAVADCAVFFDEHGIDQSVARKAVDFWGDAAVAHLKENPYRLLTICSWDRVDRTASALGYSATDTRRLVAAVESVLYDRLDRKHTWTPREAVLALTARRLKTSKAAAQNALELAVDDGAAIPLGDGYQAAGAAYMERFIEDRLQHHLIAAGQRHDLFLRDIEPHMIDQFLDHFGHRQHHPLTAEQTAAVHMVLSNTFSMLIGGAGVGKTTALRAINSASREFGFKVYQLAVAGRAAQRMAEATDQPAQTIASWLRGVADGAIEVGRHTLVIVDEASMLDLPTLYRILFYLPEDAPLLLVGDVAQLPPIGFGLTLHRLVECGAIPTTELTKILRADDTTGIPKVSVAIRNGDVPDLPKYDPTRLGCSFVTADPAEIIHAIEGIRHDLQGEEVQIVASAYAGDAGIDAINQHFHAANVGHQATLGQFSEGDPCIWTINDYERKLWNGSLGRVRSIEDGAITVEIERGVHKIGRFELDRLELAYCISVHKAQGSQFANVVMPVTANFNFDRTMLYTGLTRAVQRIVLVGSRQVLAEAISRAPRSLSREVALAWRGGTLDRRQVKNETGQHG